MWIDKEAHKIIVENLYCGEEKTHVFVTKRLIFLYLNVYYKNRSAEFFYTLYNEFIKLTRNEIK